MGYLEPFAMKKRCGECAFDPTSEAGKSPTALMASLCVEIGEPFYCHRREDGQIVARLHPDGDGVLCRGWLDAFMARGPRTDWQIAVAEECLRIFHEAGDGKPVSIAEANVRILAAGERAHMDSES